MNNEQLNVSVHSVPPQEASLLGHSNHLRLTRPARQTMPQNPPDNLSKLLGKTAAIIVDSITLTDLLHLWGKRGVAMCWNIRKQVMLNLVTEVAREQVHQPPTSQVRRATNLPIIPMPTTFIVEH